MKQFYTILVFIILLPLSGMAQVHYPIRTTTIVTPPVPYTLDGFVSQPGRLMLHIMVDDITLSQYPVKLRLHIEGNGIRITTNPNTPQQPVYLDGGVVTQLTGPDLELFFNPSNLLFQGYSQSEYNRNGRLPEGVYRIRFEVLDYYRDFQVSSAIPAVAMLSLTGAPVLTFPANRSEVDIDMTPVLRFSWMAVFSAIPDALISYRFRLWQVRPDSRDPYEIVRVTSPLYETTTHETALLYDGSMPPLTRGSRYVWQVTAVDEAGKVLFKNNGDSDIFTLRYGKQCSAPSAVITKVTHNSVAVSWNSDPSVREYAVRYKKEDATGWQEVTTRQAGITIEGLDHSALYELTVTGNCGTETSENERVLRFKTDRFVDYSCGASAPGISLENREPLPALHRFDEFMAAGFYIEVTEVSGSNGVFSGRGIASVPYLNFLQFEVVFNGITINSDHRMIDGKVVFVYDEATGMIIGGDMGRGDDADDTAPQSYNHQEALDYIAGHTVTLDEDVQTVTLDNKGQVTVVTESGQKKSFLVGENRTLAIITPQSTTIVDQASGQTFHLPNTSPGSSSDVRSRAQSKLYGCEVSFRPSANSRFGFDAVGNGVVKPNSYFLRDRNGDAIPWKSLEVGNTDRVAMLSNGDCQTDSLRFIRESGILTPTTPGNNTLELLLTGGFEGQEERLTVARATTQQLNDSTTEEILTEAGVLGLVSYQRITRDVFLVPVNNSQFPSKGTDRSVIAKRFNEVYGPGLVNWNVHVDEAIEVGTLNEADFKVEGTATLSKYTSDMNKVIRRYKRDRPTDDNTLYLFFVELSDLGNSRKGFMPLAGNFGFIFNFNVQDFDLLAHELAHGAFNLRHTFSDKAQHYFPQNQTANLMDYAGGTELWKYQWDLIHNPEKILFAFMQDEGEGEMQNPYEFIVQDLKVLSKFADNGLVRVFHCKECQNSLNQNNDVLDRSLSSFKFVNTEDRTVVYKDYVFSGQQFNNKQISCVQLFFPEKALLFNPEEYLETGGLDSIKAFPDLPLFDVQLRNMGTNDGSPLILHCVDFAEDISDNSDCFDVIRESPEELQKYVIKASNAILECTQGQGLGNVLNSASISRENVFVQDGITFKFEAPIQISKTSQLYKDVFDNESSQEEAIYNNIYDWCGVFNGKAHLVNEFGGWLSSVGSDVKFYLTDSYTGESLLQLLINKSEEPSRDDNFIWVHFRTDGTVNVFTWYKENYELHFTEKMWDALRAKLGDPTVEFLVQYLEFYHGVYGFLSENIGKLTIDEKYWNPNSPDYPNYMKGAAGYYSLNMTNPSQVQFTQFCAVWNFLVETVQAIPELGNLLTGYATDPWEARAFDDAISKISLNLVKDELKKAHGFGEGQEGWDEYRLSYQATQDVLFVASFFIGVGEIKSLATTGKAGKFARLTEKVDNVLTTIGKSADEISVISKSLRNSPKIQEYAWKITDEVKRAKFIDKLANDIVSSPSLKYRFNNVGNALDDFMELLPKIEGASLRMADDGTMYLLQKSTDNLSDALAVIRKDNNLTIGFNAGKKVPAEIVDELRRIRLKEFGHVYAASKVGSNVEDVIFEAGKYVYCLERKGIDSPGFFLTTTDYGGDIAKAVDELGILKEFKGNCKFPDELIIRKYQLKQDLPTRKSIVGEIRSVVDPTDYKPGGGLQYEIHYNGNWGDDWDDYLKFIE